LYSIDAASVKQGAGKRAAPEKLFWKGLFLDRIREIRYSGLAILYKKGGSVHGRWK
jgi:hypothetical protein